MANKFNTVIMSNGQQSSLNISPQSTHCALSWFAFSKSAGSSFFMVIVAGMMRNVWVGWPAVGFRTWGSQEEHLVFSNETGSVDGARGSVKAR